MLYPSNSNGKALFYGHKRWLRLIKRSVLLIWMVVLDMAVVGVVSPYAKYLSRVGGSKSETCAAFIARDFWSEPSERIRVQHSEVESNDFSTLGASTGSIYKVLTRQKREFGLIERFRTHSGNQEPNSRSVIRLVLWLCRKFLEVLYTPGFGVERNYFGWRSSNIGSVKGKTPALFENKYDDPRTVGVDNSLGIQQRGIGGITGNSQLFCKLFISGSGVFHRGVGLSLNGFKRLVGGQRIEPRQQDVNGGKDRHHPFAVREPMRHLFPNPPEERRERSLANPADKNQLSSQGLFGVVIPRAL
jgi:hypothetical protein